jgi:AAA15 family ATPase/GTPase
MWDATALTSLEDEVISGMQILNSQIKGINFVENKARGFWGDNRIALVKLSEFENPLSLKSLGDGIYRLFHIILALVNAKDGILLIDEFENGLHWKIHPKVWDVVFRLSEKLNVQVFATTHSSDCIRGFETAWREHLDAGTFFRLDVKEDNVKATYYNHETLKDALVADVEVR